MANRVNGTVVKEAVQNLTQAIRENPDLAKGTTSVRVRWAGGTRVLSEIRSFEPLVVDEPPALGGTDRGPTPVELLLAALGACQEITLAILAERLGIEVEAIDIELHGELDLRGFLAIDPAVRPGFQRIEMTVHITSPEPEERIQRLLARAQQLCPILDMLQQPVPVETRLSLVRTGVPQA